MLLLDYLESLPRGGKSRFAAAIGQSLSMLRNMAVGRTPVPLDTAQKIVRESGGAVSLVELVPKLRE